jgi:hypothetical protein
MTKTASASSDIESTEEIVLALGGNDCILSHLFQMEADLALLLLQTAASN